MRIRYKILLVLGLTTLILMATLLAVSQMSMINGILTSESKYAESNAQRLTNNLNIALSNLNSTVTDWAEWDDTYRFVEDNNTDFLVLNLGAGTFQNLNINLMFYFDRSGGLTYGGMYNLTERTIIPVTGSIVKQVTEYTKLFSDRDGAQGLILLDGMPMLVASDPILTSTKEGPSHGTLIIGRYLDSSQISLLSLSTGLPITSSLYDAEDESPDFIMAKTNLSLNHTIYTQPLNETTISAYALLPDVAGQPLMIIRVDDYRTEYTNGYTGLTYFLFFLVGIALTVFLVVAVLLDKIVVSRLSALSTAVTKVRNSDNNSKRVNVQGNDELSTLSVNINSMLDTIDQQTFTLEQKVAERTKDLAENRKQLESILQASPDAIVVMDLNEVLTDCNARVTEISGYTRGDIVGKTAVDCMVEEFRAQYIARHQPLVMAHQGVVRFETRFIKKSGDYPAEYSISTIRNEHNQPIGYVGIIRDLTEKKQMEQTLLRSQRLAAIGELASMVGHDLRNPLAAIRNADYYLRKKCAQCNKPMIQTMMDIIDKSIDHSNSIINDLLEYSKEIHLDLSSSSPKQILQRSLLLVDIPESIKLIDLTGSSTFKVDENKAIRVYVNLIKNAIDAMPDGGTIEVKSSQKTDNVIISFTDTGQGIPKDMLNQIFSPLFTTKAQGMGFGLSISKRIVEAHGGKIYVESIKGEGTTFTVSFPIEPKPNTDVSGGYTDGLTNDSLGPL